MSLINDILHLLAEKNKRQSDLCAYLGINTSTMTNWKNRDTDPPAKHIIPICEFLDISPYFLLTGKEKQSADKAISEDEQQFIEKFKCLNDINKGKILERMDVMLESCSGDSTLSSNEDVALKLDADKATAAIHEQKKHLA